jgi:hypothetical protein
MKPHPRIRKTIKWGGAAVTVLLVVVWVGSARMFAVSPKRGLWFVSGGHGCVYLCRADQPASIWDEHTSYWLWHEPGKFSWGFCFLRPYHSELVMGMPLWAPGSISLCLTAFAWRLDSLAERSAARNHCPRCGYDRTGLAQGSGVSGAKCPECGAAPAAR